MATFNLLKTIHFWTLVPYDEGMEICSLTAKDTSAWAQSAAETMANARMASASLSRGGAADLTRSIESTFRAGVPANMRVWLDSEGGWLWVEYADDSYVKVRGGFLVPESDIEEWATFVAKEFAGIKVVWCLWGTRDTLSTLVDAVGAKASSVIFGGSIANLRAPSSASGAWLRPMGAGELMRFQVAAANELGVALAAAGEWDSVDEARREAFRSIESELSDGVSSPGHRLYSICYGGQTVGGAWLEVDGGLAIVRSVVVDSEARGQGHRRAALSALAAAARMEGARQIQTTVIPPSHPLANVLRDMGMKTVSINYAYTPEPVHTPALQNA